MRDSLPARGGFTLIEMMAVTGVVAILALMMIPAYIDRIVRNQVAEALPFADLARQPIDSAWRLARVLPPDNASLGLPVPEKVVSNYISALVVQNGAVHMTFGNRAHRQIRGKVLSLRPAIVVDAPVVPIAWVCGYAAAPGNMTVQEENRTDIPAGYLPAQCR